VETRADYYNEMDFSMDSLTDELWAPQDAEARPQFTNYDRAKGDIRDDFELRMSIPVRLIPRNPVFVRLHMNNYVIRPETFNCRVIIDITIIAWYLTW